MLVRITSIALPLLGTKAPYSANGASKHTNQACDGKRIYVCGGDWAHSAMDDIWSMGLTDQTWRQDHAGPVYPTVPAPHALQDGAGFEWLGKRFIIWPGSYFPYEAAGAPLREWSRGMWYFDPATNEFEQDLRLFEKEYSNTGCLYGGVYDQGMIIAFGDSSGGFAVRRWDVAAGVRLPDLPLNLRRDPLLPAAYFARGKYVKIGRNIFVIGYRTNGAIKQAMMFCYNLDAGLTVECAPPPVDGALIKDLEIRPATSHGKLVWPFTTGPDGEVKGIHVYTPEANAWASDFNVPAYGNFIGNSIVSLPDGRIGFCGSVFGKQSTHYWFIEAL